LLQDQVHLAQDLPVATGPGRVVAGVLAVVVEGPAGVGQVVGVGVGDGHADPEPGQGPEGLVIEGGHRLALESDRFGPAVQGGDAELVVDEVEVDGEDGVAVGLAHEPGGDAAAGQVEGQVPPVVAAGTGGQAGLAPDAGGAGG